MFGNLSTWRILFLWLATWPITVWSQVVNPGMLDTTTTEVPGRLKVEGYVDAYYGWANGSYQSGDRPYAVSFSRVDEITVNLAYVDLRYSGHNIRARVVPAFGTYMTANYAAEPTYLKNLLEASGGVRLSENFDVWLDAGILGSPYTNESAISRDHLMLTRSLASEYVPYYLSGAKVSAALSPKVTASIYLLNGWQVIQETNRHKSLGTQLEYRPTDKLLLNWNTYLGYESTVLTPHYRGRQFTDAYAIYNPTSRWSFTSCLFIGRQEIEGEHAKTWMNANLIGRYTFADNWSLGMRYEWFSDPEGAVSNRITPVLGQQQQGLVTSSATLGLNYSMNKLLLLRADVRQFFGQEPMFLNHDNSPSSANTWVVLGLNVRY